MTKCWLCEQPIEVGQPYVTSFLFGAAHPACDDGFVGGWNAQAKAIEKKSNPYVNRSETEPDSNRTLGLHSEEL